MRFSDPVKSSSQAQPSPNGNHIATLSTAKLTLRATESLEPIRIINLPTEFLSNVRWFMWSENSDRILLATREEIRVYSIADSDFSAIIKNPTSTNTTSVHVTFGSTADEVCVFSEFGLKVSIVDLSTSKSVDINSPKFFTPGTASKGFTYRQHTGDLAFLSRHGGKDVISLHAKEGYEVTRSWYADTLDSQGLNWSLDGRWLVVWESPAHGHRALVYTADGHLFRTWNGPTQSIRDGVDFTLGPGVKLYDWSKSGSLVAVSDFSDRISVLSVPTFTEVVSFQHSTSISPSKMLQIWQEEIVPTGETSFGRVFTVASQTIFPPTSEIAQTSSEPKSGTNLLFFDKSGTLLATRIETMPTVLWIWDVSMRSLRSVLLLHASILKVTWHPEIDQLLLIRCDGEASRSLVHLWDPAWTAPRVVDFATQMIGGKVLGKTMARWLNVQSQSPAIYFSDVQDFVLASWADENVEDGQEVVLPWTSHKMSAYDAFDQQEESPLQLIPANARDSSFVSEGNTTRLHMSVGSHEDVDDTFSFRKYNNPTTEVGRSKKA